MYEMLPQFEVVALQVALLTYSTDLTERAKAAQAVLRASTDVVAGQQLVDAGAVWTLADLLVQDQVHATSHMLIFGIQLVRQLVLSAQRIAMNSARYLLWTEVSQNLQPLLHDIRTVLIVTYRVRFKTSLVERS